MIDSFGCVESISCLLHYAASQNIHFAVRSLFLFKGVEANDFK